MLKRKVTISLAVATLMASAGFALADSPSTSGNNPSYLTLDASTDAPANAPADMSTATPADTANAATVAPQDQNEGAIEYGLDKIGVKPTLDKLGLTITGYIEGGYTYNFDHHPGVTNDASIFQQEVGNHVELNQLELSVQRVIQDRSKFDVGGKIEWIYGTDAGFTHANGLEFGNNDEFSPQYQVDLEQAYIDLNLPIGNGLLLRGGKFVTLLGAETINPTTNAFYSHSYLFDYIPFTTTGIMANYQFNDQWEAWAGVVRGWDQATEDNNGTTSYTGQIGYTPNKQWSFLLNGIAGPEQYHDNGHWTSVVDLVATYHANKQLTFVGNADYGYESAGRYTGDANQWYGVALYAGYALNDYVTLNGRGEFLHDDYYTDDANVIEVTAGATITPFAGTRNPLLTNLKVRPEIRYDYSQGRDFINGTKHDEVTAAMDVIYTF